ncbi:MAG: ribosome maturation factor RimM [Chloroflexota bacterium]|jgi:16S rRNA processing protein RimM
MSKSKRRGLAEETSEPRFLVIGRVIKPHGVRGEVKVEVHTELPERFDWLEQVYIGDPDPIAVPIEKVRFHKSWVILKLAGYSDRNEAEKLRAQWLHVPEDEALPLEEGEYYLFQVIGFTVITDEGQVLGQVTEVIETKANNVFVVEGPNGEILLPDIDEVIKEVDLENGHLLVHLIPGLLP